ncbi:MAG: ferredoxin family protein [archaeon]
MPAIVNYELCINCKACVAVCPLDPKAMEDSKGPDGKPQANPNVCVECGACVSACPQTAIEIKPKTLPTEVPAEDTAVEA